MPRTRGRQRDASAFLLHCLVLRVSVSPFLPLLFLLLLAREARETGREERGEERRYGDTETDDGTGGRSVAQTLGEASPPSRWDVCFACSAKQRRGRRDAPEAVPLPDRDPQPVGERDALRGAGVDERALPEEARADQRGIAEEDRQV